MSESDKSDVWTVRGVSPETRALVKNAATANGESVGLFVNSVLRAAAFKALNMSPTSDDRSNVRASANLVEIVSKLRNLEVRLQKLEKSPERSDRDDVSGGSELIHKIIQGTVGKRHQLHLRLVNTLMESIQEINDPFLSRQMQTVIVAARDKLQPNFPFMTTGIRQEDKGELPRD